MSAPILSPTLAANEKVQKLRAQGKQVFHMGFGQAPFPVHPRLVTALQQRAHEKDYLPVGGLPELQQAVLQHQARLTGIDPDAYDVLVAPGSKLILYAAQMAIAGDILLPVPSWVSYAPQARMLGQNVVPVVASVSDKGLTLNADTLQTAVEDARARGLNPTKLLINFPGNPTGITISESQLISIAAFCKDNAITLISDEIYGRLSFDRLYRTAASHSPAGAIVSTGLSKHLSLGGWRLGVGLVPKAMTGLIDHLNNIASETWSCVSTPIQWAAVEAYSGHDDIEQFIDNSITIHQCVNSFVAERLTTMGIPCPKPQGAFYTWPDFTQIASRRKLTTSTELADYLLEQHAIVTLPGSAFGESPSAMRLRLSGCDYDGGQAMQLLDKVGADSLSDHLEILAPNVCKTIEQFERFVCV